MQDEQQHDQQQVQKQPNQKQQQGKQQPKQQRQDDDGRDVREQIRRAIVEIQASLSVQDDTVMQLARDVHEMMESRPAQDRAMIAAIERIEMSTAAALAEAQKLSRLAIHQLNERKKSRTWNQDYTVAAVFCAIMVALLALFWLG